MQVAVTLWLGWLVGSAPGGSLDTQIEARHTPKVGETVSLERALEWADSAPDVRALDAAAQARAESVSHLPLLTSNPLVLVQPALRTEGGIARPEGQLSVQQTFNIAGLAARRRELATHEATQAHLQALERHWQRKVEVSRAWLDGWVAHTVAHSAEADIEAGQLLVDRLERARSQGAATNGDVALARAYQAEAESLVLSWEGRAFDAAAQLAQLLALDELVHVTAEAPSIDEPAMELDTATLARHPHVRLLGAQYDTTEARVHEARAAWGTALSLSAVGAFEAPSQWISGVGLGLTLPLFERGQAEAAAQHLLLTRLEGERRAAEQHSRIELVILKHELEHSLEVYTVIHERQVPALREAAQAEARRFEMGEATLQEVLQVKRQLLAARTNEAVAHGELLAARVKAREFMKVLGSQQ